MMYVPLGQCGGQITLRTGAIPECVEILFGGLEPERHHPGLVAQKELNIHLDGVDDLQCNVEFALFRFPAEQYAVAKCLHDAEVTASGITLCNLLPVAREMDIEGIVSVGSIEPSEYPAQTVVGLDMILRVGKTFFADTGQA